MENIVFADFFCSLPPSKNLPIDHLISPSTRKNIKRNCQRNFSVLPQELDTEIFQNNVEVVFVITIHKSGPKGDIKNYKSVCNPSSIPKLFNILIFNQLNYYCKEIFIKKHHGSRKSICTCLLVNETYT